MSDTKGAPATPKVGGTPTEGRDRSTEAGYWDVFISWTRRDVEDSMPAHPRVLAAKLRDRGLRVWFDETEIGPFDPIPQRVREGLSNSRFVLAWYGQHYPTRRACREELTLAMLASKGESGPLRVAAIVPDGNFDRVVNSPLLDTKMIDAHDLDAAADAIASRVRVLDSTLGDIAVAPRPRLFGAEGWVDGSRRFVGRLAEMWSVHDQLHETTSQTNVGTAGRGVALVAGYGGAGKSLMAAEYAHIFAAAYPGGVCWLNANGNQASDVPDAGNPG